MTSPMAAAKSQVIRVRDAIDAGPKTVTAGKG
jgi:hypothetical protein